MFSVLASRRVVFFLFSLGVLSVFWFWTSLFPPSDFTVFPQTHAVMTGDLLRVQTRAESQEMTLLWKSSDGWSYRFLIQTDWYPAVQVWQRVSVVCRSFRSVTLAQHGSYDAFLRARGFTGVCRSYQVRVLEDVSSVYPVTVFLQSANQSLYTRLHHFFPEPYVALIAGVLLWNTQWMDKESADMFRRAGLSHITAISGYNITLILTLFLTLLFFVPFRWRWVILSPLLILFVLFTGAEPPAVRAGVLWVLGGLFQVWQRHVSVSVLAFWVAFGMLCYQPYALRDDAGFQLSFLAFFGIIWLQPVFVRLFPVGQQTFFVQAVTGTLAATLATLPVILGVFDSFHPVSVVLNILAAPVVPLLTISSAVFLLASLVCPVSWLVVGQWWVSLLCEMLFRISEWS